jgi:hypothetical protein
MTIVPVNSMFTLQCKAANSDCVVRKYTTTDTVWGYAVHATEGTTLPVILSQVVSGFFGLCLMLAGLGLVAAPGALVDSELWVMKFGAGAILAALAALCFYHATRGTHVEIQVDTNRGEVREVVLNRAGRVTVLSRIPFSAISEVQLERNIGVRGEARLIVECRSSKQVLNIAPGHESTLIDLRNRLSRDLLAPTSGPLGLAPPKSKSAIRMAA